MSEIDLPSFKVLQSSETTSFVNMRIVRMNSNSRRE